MATKEYNKTILQTSFTSIESIYYLLRTVRENQPLKHNDGTDTVFPQARAKISQARGGEWDEEKRDTHAELTLKEMRFIRYIDESTFEVSDLGNEFLDSYEFALTPSDGGKYNISLTDKLTQAERFQFIFDILNGIVVRQEKYNRNIRPYIILFKLLTDPQFHGFISKSEWAYFINNSEFTLNSQYEDIKSELLQVRSNNESHEPKKSDRILTRLVLWGVLNNYTSTSTSEKCFCLNDDFIQTIKDNMFGEDHFHTKTIQPENAISSIKSNIKLLFAIHTKPFIILGGFSGTGKSQKVKELAYLTCPPELQDIKTPGNYALISVKPNWHDSTELLGYESTIANKYMVTDFMRFVVKAKQHPKIPFFCCMDEMNLAPVEEYFAEFLSVLESRKKIQEEDGKWHIVSEPLVSAEVFKKSYKGKDENGTFYNIFEDLGLKKVGRTVSANEASAVGSHTVTSSEKFEREDIIANLKREGLCIPENLVVIGTVNMDDTTNSFSRKVIDRAMIFETDIDTFDTDSYFNATDLLQYGNVDGGEFICDEVRADKAIEAGYELSEDERKVIIDFINELNKAMAGTSFQISYRVLNEMILYYRSMQLLNDGNASLEQVKNDILMMKVLPRIEGDSAAKKALVGLKAMIEKQMPSEWVNVPYDIDAGTIKSKPDTPWKDSILKIAYMLNLLNTGDGFTRFWK